MDLASIFGSQSSITQLVNQYMTIEQRPRDLLINKRDSLNSKKTVLSDLDSKLSALKTKADRLSDPIFDYFAAKKASTSDTDKFTASAGYTAAMGNHTISVDRLAESDSRVSQQYTGTDSDFTGFVTDQIFTIEVGHVDDDGNESREQISVTIAASVFTGTNSEVLTAITDAINSSMSTAVADETINNDEIIHASVVNEESNTSRLVLRSENTGYTYRMDFGASSLLDQLEVNAAVQTSGSSGGYIHDVGTDETDSMLNTRFTMDGLTLYRDSNNVTDAITGVTLQLLDTFATTESISITTDVDSVKSEVEAFLDSYNAAINFLKSNTQINPDTQDRGVLASDLVYRDIYYELRDYISDEVTSTSSSLHTRLYQIGIESDSKGVLSITDTEKFTEALETNSTYVSDLFNSEEGLATRLSDYVDNFVKTSGTIDSSKRNIEDEVTHLNDRITYTNEILSKKEARYRSEMAKLQETMIILSNQQSFLGLFASNF